VATEREGTKPGRRRKKNLWTKDMTDVKTSIILYSKGRMKPPLTPLTDGQWLRNGKEINQEEEEKKTFGQRI
jgi:hypothetical protein